MFAVIALIVGWLGDRVYREAEFAAKLEGIGDEQLLVAAIGSDSQLVSRLHNYDPAHFDAWTRTKIVTLLRNLWQNEALYDDSLYASRNHTTASQVARRVLLNCQFSTHADLIAFATSETFYNYNEKEYSQNLGAEGISPYRIPEINDEMSKEYNEFRMFIQRALR